MDQELASEIRTAIEEAAEGRQPTPERRYHKHDQYLSYGLKTPTFRKVMKGFRRSILDLPLQKRLALEAALLGDHVGELGHAGIHVLALSVDALTPAHYPLLDDVAGDFRSWSHVDHFCGDVVQPLLDRYREDTLALLQEWNGSANHWKRRASAVAFTRGTAASGHFTEEALALCENLVWDEEDIVRKGVGWALKDNLRSAPERVLPYVKELRRRGVSSTITLYAIRDLQGREREEVLAVKKGSA